MTGGGSFRLIFAKMANLGMQIELEVLNLLRSVLYTKLTGELKKNQFRRQNMTGSGSSWLIFAKMSNLGMQIELEVLNLLRSVQYTKLDGEFKKTSFEDKT